MNDFGRKESGNGDVDEKGKLYAELSLNGKEEFDVTEYINRRFPTEESLESDLDEFLVKLRGALSSLDAELEDIVRTERHGGAKSAREVASAVEQLNRLKESVATVKMSAAEAETAVEEATKDIKPLDFARRNLLETADALRNLVSLEDAIMKLEQAADAKDIVQVGSCSGLLADVSRILSHFEGLSENGNLQRLSDLRKRSANVRERLRMITMEEFEELSKKVTTREKYDIAVIRLKSACQVADDLGEAVRTEVVGHYIGARLHAYEFAFADSSVKTLSSLDKRFAWLRREQRVHEEKGMRSVFPENWTVLQRICEIFCQATKNFITSQLARDTKEVHSMVLALQRTVEFEAELDEHFKTNSDETFAGAYVSDEDESLGELLNELIRSETWMATSSANVLKSSAELFLHIQKSMRRCAQLTTSRTFFNMHKVYKKQLRAYANALSRRVPPKEPPPSSTEAETQEMKTKWENDAKRLCAIMSTAEYCTTTLEQLEDSIKKQVDPSFRDDVNMSAEIDGFVAVSGKALKSLVMLTGNRLEPALVVLVKSNWSTVPAVGDTSAYVATIEKVLRHAMPIVRSYASKIHFAGFSDRLVSAFLPRLTTTLYKCGQISGLGAQQLLLDVSVIKSLMLEAPGMGLEGEERRRAVSSDYPELVNKEILKAELILKVLLATPKTIADTYIELFNGGSTPDLQQILEVRGLRKEAPEIITEYHRILRANGVSTEDMTSAEAAARLGNNTANDATNSGGANTVDSMKSLFGRLSNNWLSDSHIGDRLQISETAADMFKRGLGSRS